LHSIRARRPPHSLRTFSLRNHRVAIASWGLGVGIVAYWFGTLYPETIAGPGGAQGFAAIAQPTADAMRPITGPASRLDTYGGYFTYHNMGYIVLFLCIYGAIQGARAVRGDEEQGLAEMWLAIGRPRWTLVRDRVIGFLGALSCIGVLMAIGIGAGTVAAGQPDWLGSFLIVSQGLLASLVAYGLALVVSSLLTSARTTGAVCALAMVALYVINNASDRIAPFAVIKWLTPFAYYEPSRALVPGMGVEWRAALAMVVISGALIVAGAVAYMKRDSGAALFGRRRVSGKPPLTRVRLGAIGMRDLWVASLKEQRLGLFGWIASVAVLQWIYVAIGNGVLEQWSGNPLVAKLFLGRGGASLQDRYISFTVVITVGIAAAFVIWEATRWLRDQRQGRIEMALAHGVSRTRIVLERAIGLTTGSVLIGLGGMCGILIGAASSNMTVSGIGLGRVLAATLLICMSIGGVALLAVSLMRGGTAVAILTVWVAGSWIMTLLGGMANFPSWLLRTSLFDAFGDPYVGPLRNGSVVYMASLAVAGVAVALLLANRNRNAVY
jgi:putative exporter of polyketide antibiotics